ncbi:hypothetical protein AV530_004537 [Patagioenas fasciata monilis]|uniref:Uncharacterized protein n=1 Tax=Patagioenas fasciata monilis TaxID=372326 RepID=A0A1V4J5J1_PATFA|nr:hypothetical protein AV530_004537 [Patagioenas fasciata monilis]
MRGDFAQPGSGRVVAKCQPRLPLVNHLMAFALSGFCLVFAEKVVGIDDQFAAVWCRNRSGSVSRERERTRFLWLRSSKGVRAAPRGGSIIYFCNKTEECAQLCF